MNASKCRVILKPSDLTPEQCALFREKLQSAVIWQQELAGKSPHVLQFDGALQESETAFLIAHEPAELAWDAAALFDSKSPEIDDPKGLVRLAASLLDALKCAHGGSNAVLRAHGGLCPGVLLVSSDGIEKITDFGFAAAFCSALGADAYLNLAVGPNAQLASAHNATAVWEVLSPDEFEREDRLCAFVDPEKYGTAAFEGFEPGSDIIAVGFILHLIAEHRHAYLLDPEAHRLVELAEIMSMTRYNGARRKDLRESSDSGVLAWCGLVQEMLSRIPANRPTAAKLAAALAEFVPRVDQGELLRRKVEAAQALAKRGAWQELRSAVAGLPDNDSAPDDVREKARGLTQLADANMLLDRAVEVMHTDQWSQAKDPLEKVLALPALPQSVADRARKASGVLKHNLEIRDRLGVSQERIHSASLDDAESARDSLQEIVDSAKTLLADEATFPILKEAITRLGEEANEKLGSFQAEIARIEAHRREQDAQLEREREENRKQAQAWCDLLESALAEKKWDALADHLDHRPDIGDWPKSVQVRAGEIKAALATHVAEQERKAAEEADQEAARAWIGSAQEAVDLGAWDEVERLLAAKPKLRFFPEAIESQARELHGRLADYREREKDRLEAEEYVKRLNGLVERESWVEAADLLGNRPALEFWPDGPLEQEAKLKDQIEAHLEAIELQKRQIAAWLDSAETARNQKRLSEAIKTLQHPPLDANQIPEEARTRAAELIKQCEKTLAEQRKQELEAKTRAIKETVAAFLKGCIAESLGEMVQPAALNVKVGKPVFDDVDVPRAGRISVDIGLEARTEGAEDEPISLTFPFEFNEETPNLLDESDQRDLLIKGITRAVADRQVSTMALVIGGLQKGVFPKAELVAPFDPPARGVDATLHLMGRESENGTLAAALRWDTKGMRWGFDDAASVVAGVLQEAAKSVQTALPQRLFASLPELKAYESRVAFDAVPGELGHVAQLPEVLPLRARLSLKNDDGVIGSPIAEVALPLRSAGTIPEDFDAKPFVAALNKKIVAAQSSAREDMLADLKRRATDADSKAKAWATPAKIIEPTGTITFELGRKKKKPTARLSGNWQTDDFRYVLDQSYDNAISMLKEAAKSGPKKPGLALVGVLAVVLAAGAYFGSTLLVTRPPSTTANGSANNASVGDNGEGGTDDRPGNGGAGRDRDDETTSTIKAESAAKDVFRSSCSLTRKPEVSNLVDTGVIEVIDGEESASLECTIPGLVEPTIKLELELEGADWVLPDGEKERLRQAARDLCDLAAIDDEDRRKVTDAALGEIDWSNLSGLLDVGSLSFHLEPDTEPLWSRDEKSDGWKSKSVLGFFRMGGDGKKLVFPTTWQIKDGALEPATSEGGQDAGSELKDQIVNRLHELQGQSANRLKEGLAKLVGGRATVGQPPDLTSPRNELQTGIELSVTAAALLPRTFAATWNSKTLQFEPEEPWQSRGRFVAAASAALAAVNEQGEETAKALEEEQPRVMQDATWLDIADGPLVEEEQHQAGSEWRLIVAAPWSETGTNVRELNGTDLLRLSVQVPSTDRLDGASMADLLAKSKPSYWPTLNGYAQVRTDRFFARAKPFKTSLATALALAPGGFPHCALSMTLHDLIPTLTLERTGLIKETALALDAQWSAVAAPGNLPLENLQTSIEALNEKFPVILTLGVDDGGELTAKWDEADVAALRESLPKMKALEAVLADLPERMALEQALLARFGNGGGDAPSDPVKLTAAEALELLGKIRKIKGAGPLAEETLLDLFKSLENAGLFELKPSVVPSLLVEYFCGPRYCFAVAGGLFDEKINDEYVPMVHAHAFKLCASSDLLTPGGDNLGNQLLGELWSAFPNVLSPGGQSDTVRSRQAGIVLGMDSLMAMIDLPKLAFDTQKVTYVDVENDERIHTEKAFTKLSDFGARLKDLKCDAALVPYIGSDDLWQETAIEGAQDEKWAYDTLQDAVTSVKNP